MKPIPRAVLIWLLWMPAAQGGLSRLDAIGMIESGDNDRAVGRAGEVSRYQILPQVWRRYSESVAYASVEIATRVAREHLAFLESHFRRRTGREPTDFDCYVMWNGGLTYYARHGFRPDWVHPVIRERACRFVNLCQMELEDEGAPPIVAAGRARP